MGKAGWKGGGTGGAEHGATRRVGKRRINSRDESRLRQADKVRRVRGCCAPHQRVEAASELKQKANARETVVLEPSSTKNTLIYAT